LWEANPVERAAGFYVKAAAWVDASSHGQLVQTCPPCRNAGTLSMRITVGKSMLDVEKCCLDPAVILEKLIHSLAVSE